MDGWRGGHKRREEEGAERALGVERRALGGQVLTAPHTALDLQVQWLVLLLCPMEQRQTDKSGQQS